MDAVNKGMPGQWDVREILVPTNDIKEAAYYYWLKRIRQEACAQYLPAVQPENQKTVEFAKLRVDTEIAKTGATVTIHLSSATVEVKEGTSQKTLKPSCWL